MLATDVDALVVVNVVPVAFVKFKVVTFAKVEVTVVMVAVAKDGLNHNVTVPVAEERLILPPFVSESTPLLVIVTAPVVPETVMPVPAAVEET